MPATDANDDARRVQRAAAGRQRERAAAVEAMLAGSEDEPKFPTRREEIAAAYARGPEDLPNETESLADALDRVDGVRDEPVATFEDLPESTDRVDAK